jgi:hypothetical protein
MYHSSSVLHQRETSTCCQLQMHLCQQELCEYNVHCPAVVQERIKDHQEVHEHSNLVLASQLHQST